MKLKVIRNIVIIILIFSVIIPATIYANILYYSKASTPKKSDVIIVLGCHIWGLSPSLSLQYRLEKALEIYEKGYSKNIIVSGGQGDNEITAESDVMKTWLVDKGIPENVILEEDKSTNTYENLKFSKSIMDEYNMNSAIIVSNDFHIFRSLMLAKRLKIEATGVPADSVDYLLTYYRTREILSFVKSFLFFRG